MANNLLVINSKIKTTQGKLDVYTVPLTYVTDGLVMFWDAGNISSYPTTGTTVYDISPTPTYNGSISGDVTWNTSNGGIFRLNENHLDNSTIDATCDFRSGNNTIMGSGKFNTFWQNHGRCINSWNNFLMGCYETTTENLYTNGGDASKLAEGAKDTNWRIWTVTKNGTSFTMYVNNINKYTITGVEGPQNFTIGNYQHTYHWIDGSFGFLMVYNRVLTSDEMTTNFTYFKSRYGL